MGLLCKHDDDDGFFFFFLSSFPSLMLAAHDRWPITSSHQNNTPDFSKCCNFLSNIFVPDFFFCRCKKIKKKNSSFQTIFFSRQFQFFMILFIHFTCVADSGHKHLTSFSKLAIFSFLHFARIHLHITQFFLNICFSLSSLRPKSIKR